MNFLRAAIALSIALSGTFTTQVSAQSQFVPVVPFPRDEGFGTPPVEFRVSPDADDLNYPRNSFYEPTVATHPFRSESLAVVYQGSDKNMRCGIGPIIRISHDGGKTWKETKQRPASAINRGHNFHSTIAWGPGPGVGSSRLYWVNTTVSGCDYSRHWITIAWSDDEGATWSEPYINQSTAPWIGGLPTIVTDRNPKSPGYGHVYVVYNYLNSNKTGSGMRVLASTDFGNSWSYQANIPHAPLAKGCTSTWRISFRAATGPRGEAYLVGYQADLRYWNPSKPFLKGGSANVCRQAFTITKISLDISTKQIQMDATRIAKVLSRNRHNLSTLPLFGITSIIFDPAWSYGLSIDQSTNDVYLTVGDLKTFSDGSSITSVEFGKSSDAGATWSWQSMPSINVAGPRSEGRGASGLFRPNVVACGGSQIVVAARSITNLSATEMKGQKPRPPVVIGGYAFISKDGGKSWSKPVITAKALWSAGVLGRSENGVGLFDSASCNAAGMAVFAYGDGRDGAKSGELWGRTSIFLTVVDPAFRAPPRPVHFE